MKPTGWLLAGLITASVTGLKADGDPPPPAIAKDGVVNAASHMAPQFGSGAIVPGGRILIHGWRLGPVNILAAPGTPFPYELGGMSAELVVSEKRARLALVSVSANVVEAIVPIDMPAGEGQLVVLRGPDASLPFRVRITDRAFGSFSANGQGWGPGKLLNGPPGAEAASNSTANSARPGETVTLFGTGIGNLRANPLAVLVGGKNAQGLGIRGADGIDQISFAIPLDAPEGCYVPVQVRSGPGVASNFVTISIHRGGGACVDPGNWLHRMLDGSDRVGLLMLVKNDILLAVDPSDRVHYRNDTGFGAFVKEQPGEVTPLYAFPPAGTCTGYTHTTHLHGLLASASPFQMLGGAGIDAGKSLTIGRGNETRLVPIARGHQRGFSMVIGGTAPLPYVKPSPLFLRPGVFRIAGGGDQVGPFEVTVPIGHPLRWTNRDKVNLVDRSEGVELEWVPSSPRDYVIVIATNADNESGAVGMSACLAGAGARRFKIPPEALTNVPPSEEGRSLPLNMIVLAELPSEPVPFKADGIDHSIAFAVYTASRTVRYR